MVQRQILKKLSVLLTINEPEDLGDGIYKTSLTHPLLQGELSFVHSKHVGRDEVLKSLDENIVGHVMDLIGTVGDLLNGQAKRPERNASPPSGDPSGKASS